MTTDTQLGQVAAEALTAIEQHLGLPTWEVSICDDTGGQDGR